MYVDITTFRCVVFSNYSPLLSFFLFLSLFVCSGQVILSITLLIKNLYIEITDYDYISIEYVRRMN